MKDRQMNYPITPLVKCQGDLKRLIKRVAELESDTLPSSKKEMKFMFIPFWLSTWGLAIIHNGWWATFCVLSTGIFGYTVFCTYRCSCAIYHGKKVIGEIKDYIKEHYPEEGSA